MTGLTRMRPPVRGRVRPSVRGRVRPSVLGRVRLTVRGRVRQKSAGADWHNLLNGKGVASEVLKFDSWG
jgi:hypothetical protein